MRTIGIGTMIWLTATVAAAQTPMFQTASRYSLPGSSTDTFYLSTLIVADIGSPDGPPDGIADVITANTANNSVAAVKFGDGHGGFDPSGINTNLRTTPSAIALADFDKDGQPDILVGDSRTVRFLKGNGDGSFRTPGPEISAGKGVAAILATDLNGDQKLDAIIVDDADGLPGANGSVLVLMGAGNGTFTPGGTFTTHIGSESGVLGDFNKDGKTDIAVANSGSGDVTILVGDGTGNFTFGPVPSTGGDPVAIVASDLNGDTFLDLIVVKRSSDMIAILNGAPGGTFTAARAFPSGAAGSNPISLALTDLNHDGKMDVLVANDRSNDASVLLGDGHGNVGTPRAFVSDLEPQAVAAADLNADGLPDVMTVNRGTSTPNLGVLLGVGDGSLRAVEDVVSQASPTGIAAGDVDNDGLSDLIVAHFPTQPSPNGPVLVFRADPRTGFAPPTVLASSGDAVAVTAGDFNADAHLDIAVLNKSTNNVSVFLGRAAGGFAPLHDSTIGTGGSALVACDLNGDGRSDLAVARQGGGSSGTVDVLLANADGSFHSAGSSPVGTSPVAIDFGDFNKDGRRDVVVANSASNEVSVLIGKGDGTFQPATAIVSNGGPRGITVADFDRDGADDFAVVVSMNSNVMVFYGNGQGGFSAGPHLGLSGSGASIVARDVTGDLIPDILVTDLVQNSLSVFYGTGTTRQFRHDSRLDDIIVSRGPIGAACADVDGDGRYDGLAANGFLAGSVSVATNVGATPVLRGDGNGDQRVTVADALAVIRELGDSNGLRVENLQVTGGSGHYMASAGVDANGDGFITPQDALAVTHELFPGL